MKETLEKLWDEYLIDEGTKITTKEERKLTEKTEKIYEKLNALLNSEQKDTLEKYVDSLCEAEALFIKQAFLKGCEFTLSFILEAGNFKK